MTIVWGVVLGWFMCSSIAFLYVMWVSTAREKTMAVATLFVKKYGYVEDKEEKTLVLVSP